MINTYDNVNRISVATGMGFGWDGNGNMVYMDDGINEWNYSYDLLNRLVKVRKDDSLSALYTYDVGGRRVKSWDTIDGVVDYVYSGLNIIDKIRSGAHEKHIYAGFMHLASISSGTVEYYHVDHLGSTRLKTDASGNAIYKSNYEPYGPEYGESGSEEFRYTGKQEDATGLYYFGARYYDPVTGRFTARDSVFGDLTDPQSLNRYVYCRNNPHKYTDPDGKYAQFILGAALLFSGAYMVRYTIGAIQGHYKFSMHEVAREGIKGAVTGGLVATGGVITCLAGGSIIVGAIVGGLTAASVAALEPAVGGVIDILNGKEPQEVREDVADEVMCKLKTGLLILGATTVSNIIDQSSGGASGAPYIVKSNNAAIGSLLEHEPRSTPTIPNDYLDTSIRYSNSQINTISKYVYEKWKVQ